LAKGSGRAAVSTGPSENDFFLSHHLNSVFQSALYSLLREFGIIIENLGNRIAPGKETQNIRYHDPRAPNDRFAVANVGVNSNPTFHLYYISAFILALQHFNDKLMHSFIMIGDTGLPSLLAARHLGVEAIS
jgi:hypothetical protein